MKRRLLSAIPLVALAASVAFAAPAAKKAAVKQKPKPKPALPAKYKPIIARNIFGFMPRKDAAPAQSTAPVKIDTPPVNPIPRANIEIPAAPSGPLLALTGVIEVNGGYRALIEDRTSGQGYYVSEGGEAGDFRATRIYATGAVLEKPGVRLVLSIGGAKSAGQSAPSPLPPSELIRKDPNSRQWLPPSVSPRLGPKK